MSNSTEFEFTDGQGETFCVEKTPADELLFTTNGGASVLLGFPGRRKDAPSMEAVEQLIKVLEDYRMGWVASEADRELGEKQVAQQRVEAVSSEISSDEKWGM